MSADLDEDNPPLINALEVQVNGTDVTVTGVTINSTARTIIVALNTTLLPGDIIDFVYTDPTAGNDANAIQGLDGADSASFSHSIVVAIPRPGPSAPSTPTLDSSSDSGTLGDFQTNDTTPLVSGKADANATVKLYDTDGSTLLGTTTADGSGKWSITSSVLSEGSHTLKATQTDGKANTSPLSNGLSLNIDTTANAPTSMAVSAGSDSGTLGDGISNSGTPVITGKGEIGAKVSLYDTDGATVLGTATVDGAGKWSITSSTLVEGSHTLTTKQTDAAGNVSKASSDFTYIMDTVGPTSFKLGSTSIEQSKATNGATIASLNSSDITSVTYDFAVGNGVIDADNGKFTVSGSNLLAAQNLSKGSYHIYMSATDAAGNGAFQIFTITVTSGPSVTSIVRAGSASSTVPGSATSVDYTVTFSESVTGVDASDFTLTPSGNASGAVSNVTGSGATYTITVDSLTGDGDLRLDLNASGTGIKNGSSDAILSGYTSGETYTFDHTAPNATSTPSMTAGTDSGVSSSDAITKNTTPVFTGTGEANATVTLYDTDGSTVLGTTTADGSGKWSITSSKMSEGSHTLTVKQSDAAGNVSKASSSLAVEIDTSAPSAPATPVLSPGSDSGTSGDFLTNVSTPVITGTSEANATVKLYDTDGSTLLGTTTADGSGKWSITSSTLSDGSHSLTVKQTDLAGNVSSASSALTLDIDTSTPGTPGTPALDAGSDSGTLSDGITNISAPTLVGTGAVGDTITLYDTDGSTVLGTAVVDGSGNWSVTSSSLADGVHTVTVKQTNAAGTASSASKSFALTIDSSAPSAPSAPSMSAGTDSGVSSSDAITKNTTPTFTGTGEANATVTLYDTDGSTVLGTTTADGSGKWSISSSKMSEGSHTLTVKQSDAAGNVSKAGSSLAVEIDTTAPTAPATPELSLASDSGTGGDFLTNVNTPVITGTSEANATVKLYDTDGSTLLGTTTADGSGKWSITSSTLSDGSHSLTVKQTDTAGNVSSASSALTLDIDTSIPGITGTPALDAGSDSGTASDNITNITTPVITGTGVAGNIVSLYDTDGSTLLGSAVVDGKGNWSITTSGLADGAHTLTSKQSNPAGTVSTASKGLSLTIDSSTPSAPSAPSMTAGTDTGLSSSDALTKNNTPSFTGTGEANATVTLYDTDGSTVLGTTTADGSGNWSITSSKLSDGAHTLTVKQSDAAGNVSKASSSLSAQIDTSAPDAPATPVLSPASDSGTAGDFLTNVNTPVITGTSEANATVKLYDTDGSTLLGTTTADGSGKWSITSSSLNDGSHSLTVKQTDGAGNVSSVSSALSIEIDTSIPTTPATPNLDKSSDSGVPNDALTNVQTPLITGTGTKGNTVNLYDSDGVTVLGSTVVDGSGNWSITSSKLTEGKHSLSVKQSNPAGTVSSVSKGLDLEIDVTPPATLGAPTLDLGSDSGNADNLTNFTTPLINGKAMPNSMVKLYDSDGSTVLGSGTADGSGNWSITSSQLTAGLHTIMARQYDVAGNISDAGALLNITIDPVGPSAITLSNSKISDGAAKNSLVGNLSATDSTKNDSFVYVFASGVGDSGNDLFTLSNGALYIKDPASAGAGSHSVRLQVTDLAGNVLTQTLSITVDTNYAPQISGLPGDKGQAAMFGKSSTLGQLAVSDAENDVLSMSIVAVNGRLENITDADPNSAGVQLSGTAAQINAALAAATFTPSVVGSASLSLSLSDPQHATPVSATYLFDAAAQPPTKVDGVDVNIDPSPLPGGGAGTKVTIPIVDASRVDDTGNGALADIPLVGSKDSPLLSAHVPLGFGLSSSGGESKAAGNSLEDLIAAIIATTPNNAPADQAHLTGNGQSFLNLLPSNVPLLVQTVTMQANANPPSQSLTLNGSSDTAQHTALVIDVRNLPTDSKITLNEVDFAAVVGAAHVSSNKAGQILTGDAASQHFSIVPNSGSKVFSGNGDDGLQFNDLITPQLLATLDGAPSATMEDGKQAMLHGGAGSDKAYFSQNKANYKVEQFDGYVMVSNLSAPDQTVKLVNVESLQFADAGSSVSSRAELNTVAGLYLSILGRQADVGGFGYWGGLQAANHSLGELALGMMGTAEGLARGFAMTGQSAHDVAVLYRAIFGREGEAGGLAYWTDLLDTGKLNLVGVANGFINAEEMTNHKLGTTGWDFLT
ncbi:Ig-like domain-containing protein [Massilia sp. W12]|uniref:Ig-like domain-containing protein n=1 Tax=Massilia sp. W12 TaxID=3126507 RepID=UPI0030CDBD06